MEQPPPLPNFRPIRVATFCGKDGVLVGANRSARNLHEAQEQAVAWMNNNPGIELVTIKTCLTDALATVSVWFRDGA